MKSSELGKNNIWKLVFLIFLVARMNPAIAQLGTYQKETDPINPFDATIGELFFKSDFAPQTTMVKATSATLYVKTGFNSKYRFGHKTDGVEFSLKVNFRLISLGNKKDTIIQSLMINNNEPGAYYYKDLSEYFKVSSNGFSIDGFRIEITSVEDVVLPKSFENEVRIYLGYQAQYAVNQNRIRFSVNKVSFLDHQSKENTKTGRFSWNQLGGYYHVPGCELQLLKLINGAVLSGNYWVSIDWGKALSFYIEKSFNRSAINPIDSVSLTIGQGTGLYVWRIRPIGTNIDHGIADSRNWGKWDLHSPKTEDSILVNSSTPYLDFHYFNYVDPEGDKNYIFNRTFSEKTKVKEQTTYATSLENIRQKQVYLPSQNITLISQTLQDKTGRNAISTIPVPKKGKVFKYEAGLTQTELSGFYRPESYDLDINLLNPAKMNQGMGNLLSYFSDDNPDGRIPSARGYPYTRTRYVSDGTNRLTEVSGIGFHHSIGDQSQGRGRTQKVFYGTASEDELVRLFGDEAPNSKYIQKTVNIDENNVSSVTYTSVEGKVIATGLTTTALKDSLLDLEKPLQTAKVSNAFSGNVDSKATLTSTKRIVLTEKTELDINYKLSCKALNDLCIDGGITCKYKVRFVVFNNNGSVVYESENQNIIIESDSCRDDFFELNVTTQELNPGEYLIEKKLFKDAVDISSPSDRLMNELDSVANWIRQKIDGAVCFDELLTFYNELIPFSESSIGEAVEVFVYDKNNLVMTSQELPVTAFNTPSSLKITNSCCNIELDISCFPPLSCPSNEEINEFVASHPNGLDDLQVNFYYHENPENTTFLFDYEGYAVSLIRQCNQDLTLFEAKETFYTNMTGWHEEGTFNKMVYHMLTDKYSFGGFGANSRTGNCSSPTDKILSDSVGGERLCNTDLNITLPGVRYKCFDLVQCWENTVQQFINYTCKGVNMDGVSLNQSGKTISELFDEQQDGDESVHDNHFDDGFKGFSLFKWLAKRKLSKELRKAGTSVVIKASDAIPLPQFNRHLVSQFLNCSGYQFADILNTNHGNYPKNGIATGDQSPYATDSCFYSIEEDFSGEKTLRKYNPEEYFKNYFADVNSLEEWEGLVVQLNDNEFVVLKKLFPLIKHPVFAFKYFEYPYGSDNALEAVNCFRDPNYCLDALNNKVPCCGNLLDGAPKPCTFSGIGKITCPYTSSEWTTGQRNIFYKKLTERIPLYGPEGDPADMEVWNDEHDLVDCEWLRTEQSWAVNKNDSTAQVGLKYIPIDWFIELYPDEAYEVPVFVDIGGEPTGTISMLEIEALDMRNTCTNGCDKRRPEFKRAVVKMFENRCYVIDECKASLDDNVVPEQDIEVITDSLIKKCQNTCKITTYTCDDLSPCRNVSSVITDFGTLNDGNNDAELKVRLGVGGKGDCPTQESELLDCTGQLNLAYEEYVLWLMGKNWNLDLDIQAKCNGEGVYDPDYTGPDWYWYNNGKLSVYDPAPCSTQGDETLVDDVLGNPYLIPRKDKRPNKIVKKSAAIEFEIEVENIEE